MDTARYEYGYHTDGDAVTLQLRLSEIARQLSRSARISYLWLWRSFGDVGDCRYELTESEQTDRVVILRHDEALSDQPRVGTTHLNALIIRPILNLTVN